MSIITPPDLVFYETEKEYLDHYNKEYRLGDIRTFDGIRVYFSEGRFTHAFFEGRKKGQTHLFSRERAERIDWIKFTLQNENTIIRKGWNKFLGRYECHRRANLIFESYLVVIEMALTKDLNLKAKFITAFPIKSKRKTVEKIKKHPVWNREECISVLKLMEKQKNNG